MKCIHMSIFLIFSETSRSLSFPEQLTPLSDSIPDPTFSFGTSGDIAWDTTSGVHPSFVFLQLQKIPTMDEVPYQLEHSDALERAIAELDRRLTVETHKIGILYVGPGQTESNENILGNQFGSAKYIKVLMVFHTNDSF